MKLKLMFFCALICFSFKTIHAKENMNRNTVSEQEQLLDAVMAGRLDFCRAIALSSPLPGAAFQEKQKGTYYYSSGIHYAPCNGVLSDQESVPSDQEIEQAIDFFESRDLPFIWWTDDQKLEEKEFQFGGNLIGIAMDISADIPEISFPFNLQIKVVNSDKERELFSKILATGMGIDSHVEEQDHEALTSKHKEFIHFIALMDEHPIGVASLLMGQMTAGIWNLATLPEYRKQGVGTALIYAALVEAKRREYEHVMAILMPKGMAWGIFTRMGFKEICRFPFYIYGAVEALEK